MPEKEGRGPPEQMIIPVPGRYLPNVVFKSKSSSLYFNRKSSPSPVLMVSASVGWRFDSFRAVPFSVAVRIRYRDRAVAKPEIFGEAIATSGVPNETKTKVLSSGQ